MAGAIKKGGMKRKISKKYLRRRWGYLTQSRSGVLYVGGISVTDLAKKYGTPLYVIVEDEIRNRFRRMKKAFPYPKLRIQYASKCNTNLEILKIAREEGAELDASSVGEIILGILADFDPRQITFTNLYKTEDDIKFAAMIGVQAITADSLEGLKRIAGVAEKLRKQVRIFIRINPLIEMGNYTTKKQQYGIPHQYAKKAIDIALKTKYVQLVGFHFHGGYIDNPLVYFEAAKKLLRLMKYAKERGGNVRYIDLGGGFPVAYGSKKVFEPEDMGEKFIQYFSRLLKTYGLPQPILIFEPGKFMVANAGIGLTKIISFKKLGKKTIVVVDGSTYAFLPDPIIYKSYYDILPATDMNRRRTMIYTIAGCTCDSIDIIGTSRWLPYLDEGDLLAIMDCGAYSSVMASNFNTLKRAPAVMITADGGTKLIRRRDRYSEMFAPELDVLKMADPYELKKFYDLFRVNLDRLWGPVKKRNEKRSK